MPTVEAERVLHEVVRPDRDEIRLERDVVRAPRGAGCLDHRADGWELPLPPGVGGRGAQQRPHRSHLLGRLDEGEEDPQVGGTRGTEDRAKLRRQMLRPLEEQVEPALLGARKERRRLVAAEIEHADRRDHLLE